MSAIIEFSPTQFSAIWSHLLPPRQNREQAAFAFARTEGTSDERTFEVIDLWLTPCAMLAQQHSDYLELSDDAHAHVIREAHRLNASVIEMHSHLGPLPPAFSLFDRAGLLETVPHMWWRLKAHPYFALVASRGGFDALAWLDGPEQPVGLHSIKVGDQIIRPSGLSLRGWK